MSEPNPLLNLSQHLASAVAAAEAHVLHVRGGRRASTGVAWSEDVLVTTSHSLRRDTGLAIGLPDGSHAEGEVIGRDRSTDLAAVRVSGATLSPANWAPTSGLAVGNLVLVLGRPHGHVRATLGMISGLGEPWWTGHGGRLDRYIDVDASLPGGFSGGPLASVDGRVLGINTPALARGGTTVPTETISRVMESLLTHGHVRQGYLGVGVQPAEVPDAEDTLVRGLLVNGVHPRHGAAEAGIRVGDILLSVAGVSVQSLPDLVSALSERAGSTAEVVLLRGGKRATLDAPIGDRPSRRRR